jgi:hypothetical protein
VTFVVALREARRCKRLQPWWSPQQRGRRSSLVGLLNLRINPLSHVLVVVVICLLLLAFALSLSPNLPLRVWSWSTIGGFLASRKWPNIFTLPLGRGVVSYQSHKVHLSTCSSFPIGVGTADSLCRNFWHVRSSDLNSRDFWQLLTSNFQICVEIFRYAY